MNDVPLKQFYFLFLQSARMEEQPYQMDAFVSQGLVARNVKLVSEHLTYSLYM